LAEPRDACDSTCRTVEHPIFLSGFPLLEILAGAFPLSDPSLDAE
jgi:hypothetical protein